MKNLVLALSFLSLVACGGKTEKPAEVQVTPTAISGVIDAYLAVKDAMVSSSADSVTKVEAAFSEALQAVVVSDAELAQGWSAHQAVIAGKLAEMSATTDIEAKRAAFSPISDELFAAVKLFGNDGRQLFYQHCPMAFNDQGANWLSREKMIANPYFGSKMLRCGTTKETL